MLQDVMRFAAEMLSFGHAPAVVEAAIARKHALHSFRPTMGNERSRPTLVELQQEKHKIHSQRWMDKDSWADLMAKLHDLEKRPDVHVEWEDYAPKHIDPRKRNFKVFIQHVLQAQWLKRGCKVLFLDSTHGTNNYGMQLFIGATQDEQAEIAIPLFFFMCTVEEKYQQQNGLEWMFQCLHKLHPEFNPGTIMMDQDLSEHNAVAAHLMTRAKTGMEEFLQQLDSGVIVEPPRLPNEAWPSGICTNSNMDYVDCVAAAEVYNNACQVGDVHE
jgi:MULE transposase domain